MRATRRTTHGDAAGRLAWFGLAALAGSFFVLCGCAAQWYVRSDPLAYNRLVGPYRHIQLKAATTLDVLGAFDLADYRLDPDALAKHLVSQSDRTIAVAAQSDDARRTWVTLVAFDEHRMTARRKYFFCIDERATAAPTERGQKLVPPRNGLVFDAELVLAPEIQTTPYATAEARQLATVRWLIERFAADVQDLTDQPHRDNELIAPQDRAGQVARPGPTPRRPQRRRLRPHQHERRPPPTDHRRRHHHRQTPRQPAHVAATSSAMQVLSLSAKSAPESTPGHMAYAERAVAPVHADDRLKGSRWNAILTV